MTTPRFGALLMTYGSPTSLDDVPRYLAAVRGGRPADEETTAEFVRRYRVIGGSPLVAITSAQAAAVEAALGGRVLARPAMRFSAPTIEDALRELAGAGAERVATIVLSPQYSPLIMGGYGRAVDAALTTLAEDGLAAPEIVPVGAWHEEPGFVEALATRIREALDRLPDGEAAAPVLLTAHSLPRHVADREPDYLDQLTATATAVATAAGLDETRWRFCWQSAGHEPGEWMTPDFADLMPILAREGHGSVVVAPVQFLADHLEILYDIDIGAREQAEAAGLRFARIESLNTMPRFIEALASIVERALAAQPTGATGRA
ncbi:MAG TPA: ferrochelatase [Candidatus Limnocylindrales bacterium]|nr:ferrochelatase [Candidatus Limnocylindrales bacterium]